MAQENLFAWFQGRPAWQQALASALVASTELSTADFEKFSTALKQDYGLAEGSPPEWPTITKAQLKSDAASAPVTILGSIGPLKHIDRLAADQPPLRFAKAGITLIYGANGSGKSGYCRIAKRLCRCLHDVALRGNVYAPESGAPREIQLTFGVQGQEKKSVTWNDDSEPPEELGRISVFDSDAAGLYVDSERKIEFLPFELALMTRFVAALKTLETGFEAELDQIKPLLKSPLPTGYGTETAAAKLIARLLPDGPLPTEADLRAVAVWDEDLEAELLALVKEAKTDPALLLKLTQSVASTTTELSTEVESAIAVVGDEYVSRLRAERNVARETRAAAKAVADGLLDGAVVPNLGTDQWRQMLVHARQFAAEAFPAVAAPQLANSDVCVLCHQPLTPAARERLEQFDTYLMGKANEDAENAQKAFQTSMSAVRQFTCDSEEQYAARLKTYVDGSPERAALVGRVIGFLHAAKARSEAIVQAFKAQDDAALNALPPIDVAILTELEAHLASLNQLATTYQPTPEQASAQAKVAVRIAALEAQKKFASDIDIFVQRLMALERQAKTKLCIEACATGPITAFITRLRRQQLTPTLRDNFKAEVKAFDLEHLPLDLSDRAQAGVSKVQIGLETKQMIKRNSDILSEGEKRALALAGFLAEAKEIGASHGIVIDDPVSSLDHSRIEAVAKRLVEEAKTGRQVIIFTHNLVFHYAVRSAARGVPLREEWIAKHPDGRFGVIDEGQKPWISLDCKRRIGQISELITANKKAYSETDETCRPFVTKVYTKLRETWEHTVEEILFADVIGRFRPDVQTQRLRMAKVEEADYEAVYEGMTRCSRYSGHDQAMESPPDLPKMSEILADFEALKVFVSQANARKQSLDQNNKKLSEPLVAELL
ncbi:AAA family ATPase [Bradyrhizobium sp. 83002]|uniref:AAA family ATPase n=1 Tax=Bradyrhizobium aeschynomenes TaxID=2734909 RepID=UPI0015566E1F|nr:AAA family ATPase [Bradyrhizobium aeschynomenes]NPU09857.1 AAA family ATPase [Bradyrhizobium aeschynomenes]